MKLSDRPGRRIPQLAIGLFLYGIGIALMVRAQVGSAPWDVLSQGIALRTGLSFGLVTVLLSFVILLLWIPLRERPGIGTVANVMSVGFVADLGLSLVPADLPLVARIPLFAAGMVTLAIATGLYLGAQYGSGPRDGLMTGLHRLTGWPIAVVRAIIEVSVVAIGWMLGGNVGIGTLVFAVAVGPLIGIALPLFAVRPLPHPRGARNG